MEKQARDAFKNQMCVWLAAFRQKLWQLHTITFWSCDITWFLWPTHLYNSFSYGSVSLVLWRFWSHLNTQMYIYTCESRHCICASLDLGLWWWGKVGDTKVKSLLVESIYGIINLKVTQRRLEPYSIPESIPKPWLPMSQRRVSLKKQIPIASILVFKHNNNFFMVQRSFTGDKTAWTKVRSTIQEDCSFCHLVLQK